MKKLVCAGSLPAILVFGAAIALAQSPKPQFRPDLSLAK